MKQTVAVVVFVVLVCVAQAAAAASPLGRRGLLQQRSQPQHALLRRLQGAHAAINNLGSTYALAAANDQIVQAVNRGFAPKDAMLATTSSLTIARTASNKNAKPSDFDGAVKPGPQGARPAVG